jgi:uncharacterized protein (DUF952 family)
VTPLYHITTRADWDRAVRSGWYLMSTRDMTLAEQGFIHCCGAHQLRAVAERFYGDADDLVVLVIDDARLAAPVRYESGPADPERYPHIYGALPVAAVVEVVAVTRAADGRMVLPG